MVSILNLYNSTLISNHARFKGGGIDNGGTLTVTGSVITDNVIDAPYSTDKGGGIRNQSSGTATITSSIVANNHRGTTTLIDDDLDGDFDSGDNNLIGTTSGATGFTEPGDYDYIGSGGDLDDLIVVTGLADTNNSSDDDTVLSLREAVALSNSIGTGDQTIWLAAWKFILEEDVDVTEDVDLVGISTSLTSIDAVFDEIGGATVTTSRLTEV